MYRIVDTKIWLDQKFRQLNANGKLLFLYLVTNSHTHVGGIYYLPKVLMSFENTLSDRVLDTLFDTLSKLNLVKYDQENSVVWVVNMLKYQGRGDKNLRSVAAHLDNFPNSKLIQEFILYYPDVKKYISDTLSDTLSDRVFPQEQEQEQDQEQDQDTTCSEPENGSKLDDEVFINLPLNDNSEYPITESYIEELKPLFQAVDIEQELREMRAWCINNPKRRKTKAGITRFINSWLSRKQDNGRGKNNSGGASSATSKTSYGDGNPYPVDCVVTE